MKITFRLKTFEGHVGIIGHQGGSLPRGSQSHIKFLQSPSDVKFNYENRNAYFITANGDIVDLEGSTHAGFLASKAEYPEELKNVFGIKNADVVNYQKLVNEAIENGTLRVIWSKKRREVDIHVYKIDVNSIRNIKKLIRIGKLPIADNYYIDGTIDHSTGLPRGLNISFTISYEGLMHNAMTPEIIANL